LLDPAIFKREIERFTVEFRGSPPRRSGDYILTNREEFKKINLDKVIKIHVILTGGLGIGAAFRTHPVAITGTNYLPLTERDSLIKALNQTIKVINSLKNTSLKAFIAS